jgi:hypothetical protein
VLVASFLMQSLPLELLRRAQSTVKLSWLRSEQVVSSQAIRGRRTARVMKELLERLAIYQEHQKEYLQDMMNSIIQSPEGRKRIDEYVQIGLRTPPDLGVSMPLMDFIAYDRRAALASSIVRR